MKRIAACCVAAGILLVVCVISSRFAGAQSSPGAPPLVPAPPIPIPVVAPPPPLGTPAPPPTKKAENVYELLAKLADIKAKKAELDEAEKETTSLLKKELLNLQQQTQKLGVNTEGSESAQSFNRTIGASK